MPWSAVLITAAGCYLLKLAGMAAPRRLLERPLLRRFAAVVPVALLAALIAVQAFTEGREMVVDLPRSAGLGAAVLALVLRAPFLVVLAAAAVTTAGLRAAGFG